MVYKMALIFQKKKRKICREELIVIPQSDKIESLSIEKLFLYAKWSALQKLCIWLKKKKLTPTQAGGKVYD